MKISYGILTHNEIDSLLKLIDFLVSFKDDEDENDLGDVCTSNKDEDKDGIDDNIDNCASEYNPEQLDDDTDGFGNACDVDIDNDGITNEEDNCKYVPNPIQEDYNKNDKGDACEEDEEGDGCVSYSLLF